jgi:hypothetical protein
MIKRPTVPTGTTIIPSGGGGGAPPGPLTPGVEPADFALQFVCGLPSSLQGEVRTYVRDALREPDDLDAPDVHILQVGDKWTVGAWMLPVSAETAPSGEQELREARERMLPKYDLLDEGETFAVLAAYSAMLGKATKAWNAVKEAKRLAGNPGPTQLHTFALTTQKPNRVRIVIYGSDETPWPDVDFAYTVLDTLQTVNGILTCHTERTLSVSHGAIDLLGAVSVALGKTLGQVLGPLGTLFQLGEGLGGVFLAESAIIEGKGPDDVSKAQRDLAKPPGCTVAKKLPRSIPIGADKLLSFSYHRVEAYMGDLTFGGNCALLDKARVADPGITADTSHQHQ